MNFWSQMFAKNVLADEDVLMIGDSAAPSAPKHISIANFVKNIFTKSIIEVNYSAENQDEAGKITIPISSTQLVGATQLGFNLFENGKLGISGSITPVYSAGVIVSVLLEFDAQCGAITGTILKLK